MQLFLIRHLETDYNRQGLLQGSMDIPILAPDENTLAKIQQNKQHLAQHAPFDKILISEFQRTRQTAEHYGFKGSELEIEALLNELNFGHFEGQTKDAMLNEIGNRWKDEPQSLSLGEPLLDLGQRVQQLIEKYQHLDRVLVFGHGSWLRALDSIYHHGNISQMNKLHIANNTLIEMQF